MTAWCNLVSITATQDQSCITLVDCIYPVWCNFNNPVVCCYNFHYWTCLNADLVNPTKEQKLEVIASPIALFYWIMLHYLLILVVLKTVNEGEIDNKTDGASEHELPSVVTLGV